MPLLHVLFSRNYRFVLNFEQQLKDYGLSRAVSQQICDSSARHLSAVYFWTDSDYSSGIQLCLICLTGVYTFYIFLLLLGSSFILHFILAGVEQKRVGL